MKSIFILFFFTSFTISALVVRDIKNSDSQEAKSKLNTTQAPAIRFMALGDWGTGGSGQKAVARAMTKKKQTEGADFVITLGDNFYPSGVSSTDDQQWKTKFEDVYDATQFNIPFYSSLGNHDYGQSVQIQIDYCKKNSRWKMPARYYSFTKTLPVTRTEKNSSVAFFALDTPEMIKNDKASEKQLHWLDSLLASCTADWKIVYGHHPIFSNGYHGDSPLLKKILKPILEKHHVDVYFAGHDHDLQMLKPANGVNYVINGGGGAGLRKVRMEENTSYAQSTFGFVYCSLSINRLDIQFIDSKSNILYSTSIRK